MTWFELKPKTSIDLDVLKTHLKASGLGEQWTKKLPQTYAFVRGLRATVKSMADAKLIDRVLWTQETVSFQISGRLKVALGIDYTKEAVVMLDRATGVIASNCGTTQAAVIAEFTKAEKERRTQDITRLIRRILDQKLNTTVFPIKGGAFFVATGEKPLLDNIETFVSLVGGHTVRWAIAEGAGQNNTQVQTVVVDSLQQTIYDIENHISDINAESTDLKVRNAQKKLDEINTVLLGNAKWIGDQLGRLEDYLATCRVLLEKRQEICPETVSEPFHAEPDDREEPEGIMPVPDTLAFPEPVETGINSLPAPPNVGLAGVI